MLPRKQWDTIKIRHYSENTGRNTTIRCYAEYNGTQLAVSLRMDEPLPELSPQTPVSGYSWPRRTQVADDVASQSCFRSSLPSWPFFLVVSKNAIGHNYRTRLPIIQLETTAETQFYSTTTSLYREYDGTQPPT